MLSSTNDNLPLVGQKLNPTVVISACVHGDERIGKEFLDWFYPKLQPEYLHGTLTGIFANPAAYKEDKRFIDEDMNRLFDLQRIQNLPTKENLNTEEKRVLAFLPALAGADFLIDLHATRKPTRHPFIVCMNTPMHIELAKLFDVDVIVTYDSLDVISTMNTSLDNYIDATGGIGLTVEAGWKEDPNLFERVKDGMLRALLTIGILDYAFLIDHNLELPPRTHESKIYSIYQEVIAKTADFKFATDAKNFDFLAKGAILAYDGDAPLVMDRDSYIIFPKLDLKQGLEACYLAAEIGI